MRKVAIIGIGQTRVAEHWSLSLRDLALQAIIASMKDASIDSVDGLFVGNMLSGIQNTQEHIGPLVADWAGLKRCEAFKIEAACGSGAVALRIALMAVASGELDSALVLGVEKMTDAKGVETTAALASASDADYESAQGVSFVALNALIMQRYMFEYGWMHEDFAQFSINSHVNALNNQNARLHEYIDENDYHRSRMIATPINLLDASPIGDGAAAVIIVPADSLSSKKNIITIVGSASATVRLALHDRLDLLWLSAVEKSSKLTNTQAGTKPEDIDVFELHDAFSIIAALSLESVGLCERGEAPRLAIEGEIALSGKFPISTLGGLKARGHPVGATGIYQIIEIVQQLRGEAGESQIENATIGMAQNIGGSGATVITHIMKRENPR